MRILITGVPHSGKTTLAKALQHELSGPWAAIHWDNYKHLAWEEQKVAVLRDAIRLAELGHVLVEGCGAVRLLRPVEIDGKEHSWNPQVVIECTRESLADPKHKGLAGVVRNGLAQWSGEILRVPDAVRASATLAALVAMGAGI